MTLALSTGSRNLGSIGIPKTFILDLIKGWALAAVIGGVIFSFVIWFFIKAGSLHAITYQSAESDGALPMKLAADWFGGKPIEKPVYYLQKHIITAADVDKFLPAQW